MLRITGAVFALFTVLSASLLLLSRSSRPHWLVFAADQDDGIADIFVMDAARRMLINLTDTPGINDDTPGVSADGTQIAFSRSVRGSVQICVHSIGSGELCYEPVGRWDSEPHWSPDGTQIVFTTPGQANLAELVLLKPATSEEIRMSLGQDYTMNPDWSPDGRAIVAVNATPSTSQIILIQMQDGEIIRLSEEDTGRDIFPVWSPDGSQIAYLDDGSRLALMNADGSNVRFLTGDAENVYNPSWSSDGEHIVFQSDRDRTDWDLFILDVEEGTTYSITENEALDERPAWSPDGTQIAFRSDRDGDINLYLYDVANGTTTRLTDGNWFYHPPVWPGQ